MATSSYIGAAEYAKIYHGSTQVDRVYVGAQLTFEKPAGGAPVLWTPAQLTQKIWLDATNASDMTFSSGAVVSQWNDLSGNAHNYSRGAVGDQPSRVVTATYPAVDFAGSKGLDGPWMDNLINNSTYTLIAVCSVAAFSDENYLFAQDGNSQGQVVHWGAKNNTEWRHSHYYDDADIGTPQLEQLGRMLVVSRYKAPGTDLHINGVFEGENLTQPPANAYGNTASTLGYRSDNKYWNDEINEFGAMASALSDTDLQKYEGYLAHKWGITLPAGHPYFSAPPNV